MLEEGVYGGLSLTIYPSPHLAFAGIISYARECLF